jgi:hypothetical protein
LAEAERLRRPLIDLDRDLTDICDWADDGMAGQPDDPSRVCRRLELRSESDRLIARLDRLRGKLSEDIDSARYQEAKDAKDVMKEIMYVGGLPAIAVNLMRVFYEKSHAIPYVAAAALVAGVWTAFPKDVQKAWRASRDFVCDAPQRVRTSFVVYYLGSEVKENARSVRKAFSASSGAIADRASGLRAGVRRATRRLLNPPRPSL